MSYLFPDAAHYFHFSFLWNPFFHQVAVLVFQIALRALIRTAVCSHLGRTEVTGRTALGWHRSGHVDVVSAPFASLLRLSLARARPFPFCGGTSQYEARNRVEHGAPVPFLKDEIN